MTDDYRDGVDRGDGENEKLELLKALRRSQTRAREAEKKAEKMAKKKGCLSNAFLGEANVLVAYRQWVKLLELQVSKLQSQLGGQVNHASCDCGRSKGVKHSSESGVDGENGDRITWIVALALCLGIAGVGLAFGWRYLY